MDTKNLIDNLAKDAKPVSVVDSTRKRVLIWAAFALIYLLALVSFIGVRSDLAYKMADPWFFTEFALNIVVVGFCLFNAIFLSTPRIGTSRLKLLLPLITLLTWSGVMLIHYITTDLNQSQGIVEMITCGFPCSYELIFLSLVPGVILFYLVRKGAPLQKAWVGVLCFFTSSALASLILHFVCPSAHASHGFFGHLFPVLILGSLGLYVGDKLFNWDK